MGGVGEGSIWGGREGCVRLFFVSSLDLGRRGSGTSETRGQARVTYERRGMVGDLLHGWVTMA